MFWVDIVDCFQHFFFFLLAFEALDSFCMFLWCYFFPIRRSPVAGLNEITCSLFNYNHHHCWRVGIFSFLLSVLPLPPTPPRHLPPPHAAAAQVLVDSDKTNLSTQQTIVSNTLQQAWLSSPPFRSGWHQTTKLGVRTAVLCSWSWKSRGGKQTTCLLIKWLNLRLPFSRWLTRGMAMADTSAFISASNAHVNNSICAL